MSLALAIPALIDKAWAVFDKLTISADEKAQAQKHLLEVQLESYQTAIALERERVNAQAAVIQAEAKGESWMQRNWRPILMLSIVGIIVNNYILVPYANAIGLPIQQLPLPGELYTLMTIGVGGYIAGRTVDKNGWPQLKGKDANGPD